MDLVVFLVILDLGCETVEWRHPLEGGDGLPMIETGGSIFGSNTK